MLSKTPQTVRAAPHNYFPFLRMHAALMHCISIWRASPAFRGSSSVRTSMENVNMCAHNPAQPQGCLSGSHGRIRRIFNFHAINQRFSGMRDLGFHDRIHRILPNHAIKQRILRCWGPGSHGRIRRILHNDAIKTSF